MSFRITGLSPEPFRHLFGLPDAELARHGAIRYVADRKPGYPDRIEMRDAEPGETLLLLNHMCQSADTPYRATHAIFVREGARQAFDAVDEVPAVMRTRLLSLRAFDAVGMMIDADIVEGEKIETVIERLLAEPAVSSISMCTTPSRAATPDASTGFWRPAAGGPGSEASRKGSRRRIQRPMRPRCVSLKPVLSLSP